MALARRKRLSVEPCFQSLSTEEDNKMSQAELLNLISELQFVCVELNLYLDTKPDDESAKRDYICYGDRLKEAMTLYESLYGPLMNFGHSPTETGCYVHDPWPWE